VTLSDVSSPGADLDRLTVVLRREAPGSNEHRLLDDLSAVAATDNVGAADPGGDDAVAAIGRLERVSLAAEAWRGIADGRLADRQVRRLSGGRRVGDDPCVQLGLGVGSSLAGCDETGELFVVAAPMQG
jgi:hypothetical protein